MTEEKIIEKLLNSDSYIASELCNRYFQYGVLNCRLDGEPRKRLYQLLNFKTFIDFVIPSYDEEGLCLDIEIDKKYKYVNWEISAIGDGGIEKGKITVRRFLSLLKPKKEGISLIGIPLIIYYENGQSEQNRIIGAHKLNEKVNFNIDCGQVIEIKGFQLYEFLIGDEIHAELSSPEKWSEMGGEDYYVQNVKIKRRIDQC